jgi:hypothetical protein
VRHQALFLCRHQACGTQNLQVLGGIGDGQAGFFGQNLDGSRSLAKEVKELQTFGTGNRLANAGKLFINRILKSTVWIFHYIILKYSID